jgi:small-conductance mechanosensitive channel
MDSNDELELIYKLTFILRVILMLILASTLFPLIFSLFPATEEVANQLIGLVISPLTSFGMAILNYIPNLFAIFIIVYVVRIILKYLKIASQRIERGRLKINGFYPEWSKTTFDVVKVLIIALSFVMLFPYLPGAQSDVFKGVSVFIGVIFSLGSTSIIGNLVAGLVLTYMRPFKIGDRIKIADVEGEIVEKTAFVIRVKTPKNEYITIPNSNVQSSHITNYNRSMSEGGVILFTEITIGYDVPWRKVHKLLLKAADMTPDLEKKPEPFVLQKELGDHSINYQINGFTKRPLYKDLINSLLHQNIQDIFIESEIEILSPKYVASRDGSGITIPKEKE